MKASDIISVFDAALCGLGKNWTHCRVMAITNGSSALPEIPKYATLLMKFLMKLTTDG